MHGNAAEWTRSEYRPYPYREPQAEEGPAALRVVRGGSFHDRPCRARSGFRWRYAPWQPAFNVGFRVAGEAK